MQVLPTWNDLMMGNTLAQFSQIHAITSLTLRHIYIEVDNNNSFGKL